MQAQNLHIGWHLDLAGVKRPGVEVNLDASGLKAHTAIIAQSGSGKSFTLGRLLEEILLKTEARVLILDPNSDFIRFSDVRQDAWHDPHLEDWFGPDDTFEAFQSVWDSLRFRLLSTSSRGSLGLTQASASKQRLLISRPSLRWGSFTPAEQANYLNLSASATPGELLWLDRLHAIAQQSWPRSEKDPSYTLKYFHRIVSSLGRLTGSIPGLPTQQDDVFAQQSGLDPLEIGLQNLSSQGVMASLVSRVSELQGLGIWDRVRTSSSLPAHLRKLGQDRSSRRAVCIDLASIDDLDSRLIVVDAALSAMWALAREKWENAIGKPREDDTRYPFFIVLDEAHNMAPADAFAATNRAVRDNLTRIAAEGRKYGLFLILVTQRPARVDPGLLSQCDNLILMKMSNRSDVDLVQHSFGFLPPHYALRALDLNRGDALLSGQFVEIPVAVHVAPRRTVEGGRNIQNMIWLRQPLSARQTQRVSGQLTHVLQLLEMFTGREDIIPFVPGSPPLSALPKACTVQLATRELELDAAFQLPTDGGQLRWTATGPVDITTTWSVESTPQDTRLTLGSTVTLPSDWGTTADRVKVYEQLKEEVARSLKAIKDGLHSVP